MLLLQGMAFAKDSSNSQGQGILAPKKEYLIGSQHDRYYLDP
jgi:hypothetical protein